MNMSQYRKLGKSEIPKSDESDVYVVLAQTENDENIQIFFSQHNLAFFADDNDPEYFGDMVIGNDIDHEFQQLLDQYPELECCLISKVIRVQSGMTIRTFEDHY